MRSGVALDALTIALAVLLIGDAAAGPSMVRAAPRVGARLAVLWCPALMRRSGQWRALERRRGTLRGPALHAP